jgi:hypothetical protein
MSSSSQSNINSYKNGYEKALKDNELNQKLIFVLIASLFVIIGVILFVYYNDRTYIRQSIIDIDQRMKIHNKIVQTTKKLINKHIYEMEQFLDLLDRNMYNVQESKILS